jgi:hypothetical protein
VRFADGFENPYTAADATRRIPRVRVERAKAAIAMSNELDRTVLIRMARRHPMRCTTRPSQGDETDAVRKNDAVNTPSPVAENPNSAPIWRNPAPRRNTGWVLRETMSTDRSRRRQGRGDFTRGG